MNIWHDISPARITAKTFEALIEIPKGCKAKYELDKETGILRLDRVLLYFHGLPCQLRLYSPHACGGRRSA